MDENFNSTPFVWSTAAAGTGTRNDAWTLRADGYTRSSITFNSNDDTQFYLSDSDIQGSGSNTATTLQSPAFSTVGLTAASLSFYHYYRDYDTNDSAIVEVSTNGTTWTPITTYTTTQGSATGFVLATLNLASYLNQATVAIRFRYVAVWGYYWAVDNVSVTGTYATSPPPTYVWTSTPSGYTSSIQNPTGVSPSGNRSYTVTVTNNYGCTASATTSTVTVNPNVTASVAIAASPSSTICSGTNVTFTATPTNGGTPSYQWKLNGGNVGTNSPTYSNNALANGNTVSVVMTSTAACVTGSPATSNTVSMTVNNLPTIATVSTPPAICAGTSLNPASPTVTANGSTVTSQSWQLESAVGSNTFNNVTLPYTVTFADNGKKARYTATNGCGTTNGNQVILTVNAASTAATISGTTGICFGSTANLQVAITGGLSPYTVVYSGGTLNSYVSNTNIPVSPTSTANYTITSVTDANGCVGTGYTGTATVTLNSTSSSDGISWSNGVPTGTVDAILTGGSPIVLGANLNACSLTVNGPAVTVMSGFNVDLNGAMRVTSGSFTLNNNSNLIQHNSGYTNSGNIVVKRNSAAIKRLDYTLWSSPVAGQGLYAFSKFTLPNRFYVYNSSNDTYSNSVGFNLTGLQYPSPLVAPNGVNGNDLANVPFLTGKGYLIRVPYDHPTTPTVYAGTFTGVPNTGTITLSSLTSGLYYAIGNPYPSTIDADQFIADNTLGETLAPGDGLYFWRKTNNSAVASYATYTTAGGVASGGDTSAVPIVPNRVIQVGEGFIVRATSTSIEFNNDHRIANNDNQFLKTNLVERNRIWLNLTDATSNVNQMMVSYMTGATQDIDAAIDGRFFMDSPTALNSLLNNEEFAIQGRSLPFEATDIVPLAFKAAAAGSFSVAIDHVDGLFTGGAQAIYIKDNLTTTVHDLTTGAYSFATAAGTFNNRFEIVYQPQLANPIFTTNAVVIYSQNNGFVVNSGNFVMSSIKVFDIRGRLIEERKAINANQTTINGGLANEVLLVQITTEDGITVTKKVIK
ncbi:MAG: T9SS sorting signal type C domain-containing protein [Flavobacterium sp. JAD_PAG50586_2]|nr:MAG: T9SS sorting signal type C domain-containing protein [Flavobacterium sp. JAD_PAG50586_2]